MGRKRNRTGQYSIEQRGRTKEAKEAKTKQS
jgi:hypothetical protein